MTLARYAVGCLAALACTSMAAAQDPSRAETCANIASARAAYIESLTPMIDAANDAVLAQITALTVGAASEDELNGLLGAHSQGVWDQANARAEDPELRYPRYCRRQELPAGAVVQPLEDEIEVRVRPAVFHAVGVLSNHADGDYQYTVWPGLGLVQYGIEDGVVTQAQFRIAHQQGEDVALVLFPDLEVPLQSLDPWNAGVAGASRVRYVLGKSGETPGAMEILARLRFEDGVLAEVTLEPQTP